MSSEDNRVEILDLTDPNWVQEYMQSSPTEDEWNRRVDRVKASNNGKYPLFWSGIIPAAYKVAEKRWGISEPTVSPREVIDAFKKALDIQPRKTVKNLAPAQKTKK